MKIDTDDWMTMPEVCAATGIAEATAYRIARRLGLTEIIFGAKVVRKRDVSRIVDNKKRVGNPRWIESYDDAAAASLLAVESRKKRVKSYGPTAAELKRNRGLSKIAKARARGSGES